MYSELFPKEIKVSSIAITNIITCLLVILFYFRLQLSKQFIKYYTFKNSRLYTAKLNNTRVLVYYDFRLFIFQKLSLNNDLFKFALL